MNEAHVDAMKRIVANLLAGDLAAVTAELSPTCQIKILGMSDDPVSGNPAIAKIGSALCAAFSPLEIEIKNIYADDTSGFAELVVGGVHVKEFDGIPPSEQHVTQSVCVVVAFNAEKIESATIYADRREVLQQVGYAATISASSR